MPTLKVLYATGKMLGCEFVAENWADADAEARECPEAIAQDVWEHYNQYTEGTALCAAINGGRDPERGWEEFRRGLDVGARHAARVMRG